MNAHKVVFAFIALYADIITSESGKAISQHIRWGLDHNGAGKKKKKTMTAGKPSRGRGVTGDNMRNTS